jgi:hypothetical protein
MAVEKDEPAWQMILVLFLSGALLVFVLGMLLQAWYYTLEDDLVSDRQEAAEEWPWQEKQRQQRDALAAPHARLPEKSNVAHVPLERAMAETIEHYRNAGEVQTP